MFEYSDEDRVNRCWSWKCYRFNTQASLMKTTEYPWDKFRTGSSRSLSNCDSNILTNFFSFLSSPMNGVFHSP
ncbi:hypothetical protein K1719_029225 [Acacia pycnantha]|nr:hypothetical protein K1719_029225 [Acacia pycnantha]